MKNEKVVTINDEQLAIDRPTPAEREEMCPVIAAVLAENAAGFDLLLSDFRRDCKPANVAEDTLIQLMVRHFWTALRKTRVETGLIESQMERVLENQSIRLFAQLNDMTDPGVNFEFDTRRLGLAFDIDCANNKSQLTITRVAAASDAGFLKAYSMLLKVQALRLSASPRKRDRAA